MKSLFLLILSLSFASPAWAKPSLGKFVDELETYSSTEDWIARYPHLSALERKMFAAAVDLPSSLPSVKIETSGHRAFLVSEGLKVDVTQIALGILVVDGRQIQFSKRQPVLNLAAKLARGSEQRSQLDFLLQLLIPEARAEMSDVCLGKYEFLFRSPYGILDSKAGYLPHLLIAGIGLGFVRNIRDTVRFCDSHVRDLNALLRENMVGIKEIDCGAEESGSDRTIEFWIPERDAEGEFKTKKFNLDYSILVAHEPLEEEEDEEKKARKIKTLKPENYFIFSMSSELEEVRQLGANAKENNFQCSSVKKGDPTFAELQKRIKPYQGVMKYLGSNESCTACKKELLLRVRSVEPPTYFPALPPKPEKKAVKVKGKSSPTTTPKEKTGAASAN